MNQMIMEIIRRPALLIKDNAVYQVQAFLELADVGAHTRAMIKVGSYRNKPYDS